MRPWRNTTGKIALTLLVVGASTEPTARQSVHGFCYVGDVEIHDQRFQGSRGDATTISGTVYFSDVFPIRNDAALFQARTGFQSYIEETAGVRARDEITRRGGGVSFDVRREHAYVECRRNADRGVAEQRLGRMSSGFPLYLFQDLGVLVSDNREITLYSDSIEYEGFQFRITNTVRAMRTNWKPSVP